MYNTAFSITSIFLTSFQPVYLHLPGLFSTTSIPLVVTLSTVFHRILSLFLLAAGFRHLEEMANRYAYYFLQNDPSVDRAVLPWKESTISHLGIVEGYWCLRNETGKRFWTVLCEKTPVGYAFTTGWRTFLTDNNVTDQAVFVLDIDLSRNGQCIVLSRAEHSTSSRNFFSFVLHWHAHCPIVPKRLVDERRLYLKANSYLNLKWSSDFVWKVKLEWICECEQWLLTEGWGDFYKQFPLEKSYLVVFSYISNNDLKVRVFGLGGNELSPVVKIGEAVRDDYVITLDDEEDRFREMGLIEVFDGFEHWKGDVVIKNDDPVVRPVQNDPVEETVIRNEEEENHGLVFGMSELGNSNGLIIEDSAANLEPDLDVNVVDEDLNEEDHYVMEISVPARERLRLTKAVERLLNVEEHMTIRMGNLDGTVDELPVRREKSGRTFRFAVMGWSDFKTKNGIQVNDRCHFRVYEGQGVFSLASVTQIL